jgi:hypothetical protein
MAAGSKTFSRARHVVQETANGFTTASSSAVSV